MVRSDPNCVYAGIDLTPLKGDSPGCSLGSGDSIVYAPCGDNAACGNNIVVNYFLAVRGEVLGPNNINCIALAYQKDTPIGTKINDTAYMLSYHDDQPWNVTFLCVKDQKTTCGQRDGYVEMTLRGEIYCNATTNAKETY